MNVSLQIVKRLIFLIPFVAMAEADDAYTDEDMPFDMSVFEAPGAGIEELPTQIVDLDTEFPEIRVNGEYSRIATDQFDFSTGSIPILSVSDDDFFKIDLKSMKGVWVSSRDVVTDLQQDVELECVDMKIAQAEHVQLHGVRGVGEACKSKEDAE